MDSKPASSTAPATPADQPKVKPCCVCKPEKASRDECLLFHGQDSAECKPVLEQYKSCMRGYGFTV